MYERLQEANRLKTVPRCAALRAYMCSLQHVSNHVVMSCSLAAACKIVNLTIAAQSHLANQLTALTCCSKVYLECSGAGWCLCEVCL